jgi:rubrerythrin
MESLYLLFEKAEQIEQVMSDIYLLLAEGASDPRDAKILRQLHEEELQHAARIRMFASAYLNDRRNMQEVAARGADLSQLLADAKGTLESMKAAPPSIEEAFRLATAMEQRLAGVHIGALVTGMPAGFVALFASLEKQDRAHAGMLAGATT